MQLDTFHFTVSLSVVQNIWWMWRYSPGLAFTKVSSNGRRRAMDKGLMSRRDHPFPSVFSALPALELRYAFLAQDDLSAQLSVTLLNQPPPSPRIASSIILPTTHTSGSHKQKKTQSFRHTQKRTVYSPTPCSKTPRRAAGPNTKPDSSSGGTC